MSMVPIETECPETHSVKVYPEARWVRGSAAALGILVQGNGVPKFRDRCTACGRESGDIPKRLALEWGDTWSWVRVAPEHPMPRCSVRDCEKPGSEWHHFAPRNMFGIHEADRWPHLPLCREHHVIWHRTMNGYRWNAKSVNTV